MRSRPTASGSRRPMRPRRLDGALFHVRAAVPRRARELDAFRPGRDRRRGSVRRRGRARGRGARPAARAGDRRGARRLAHVHAAATARPCPQALRAARRTRSPCAVLRGPTRPARSRAFTSGLVEEARGQPADASFATYSDLSAFTAEPVADCPTRPTALFVGMLEAYKNVDGLAAAWRRVAARMPGGAARGRRQGLAARARSTSCVRDLPDQVEHLEQLDPEGVALAARRGDAARPALLAGRARPRRDRGVRARARRRRDRRRRRARPRRRRPRRAARPAGRRGRARRGALARARRPGARSAARRGSAGALSRLGLHAGSSSPAPCASSSSGRSPLDGSRAESSSSSPRRSTPTTPSSRRRSTSSRALARRVRRGCPCSAPHVGRHELPANVRVRTFGAPGRLARGVPLRARSSRPSFAAASVRTPCSRTWCLCSSLLAAPLAKPRRVPAPPLVPARHGEPCAPARGPPRRRRPHRRRPLVPAPVGRRCTGSATRSTSSGSRRPSLRSRHATAAAAARARPLCLGEGLRHACSTGSGSRSSAGSTPSSSCAGRSSPRPSDATVPSWRSSCGESPVLSERVELAPTRSHATWCRSCSAAPTASSAPRRRGTRRPSTRWSWRQAPCGVPVLADERGARRAARRPPASSFASGPRDAESLAETLLAFAAAGPERRTDAGAELRRRVVAGHSVESWADAVTRIVAAQTRE